MADINRCLGQQHHKLFAAETAEQVGAAQQGLDVGHQVGQHTVALLVAQGVIDLLEVVDIQQQHRQVAVVPQAAGQFALQRVFHVPAGERVGQRVMRRCMLQLTAQPFCGQQHLADGHQHDDKGKRGQISHVLCRRIHHVLTCGVQAGGDESHRLDAASANQHAKCDPSGQGLAGVLPHQPQVGKAQRGQHKAAQLHAHAVVGRCIGKPDRCAGRQQNQQHPWVNAARYAKKPARSEQGDQRGKKHHQAGYRGGQKGGKGPRGGKKAAGHKTHGQRGGPQVDTTDARRVIALEQEQHG